MSIIGRAFRWAVLAGALWAIVGTNARAEASATKLLIPFQAVGIGVTPLWTAIELKLFQKYGIDATTQFVSQSPTLVAAVLSGDTPFANVGEDAVISADLNGGDIVILVSGPEKLFFEINSIASIKSPADLKGKRIGISQFGATTDFIARYVLKQVGLDAKRDATILPMGPQAANLAALQGGMIDATVLAPPTTIKAEQLGFPAAADLLNYDLLFYTSALVGKRSYIKTHPDETMAVVKAYVAGSAAVFTNKAAAKAAIGKYSDTTDPKVLEASYQLLTRALPKIPVPKPAAIQTGLSQKTDAAAKTADPASFIDPSFVDQLAKSGFIDHLYQ
jgi:NitT/TauT family transport system substrate-binding protein